MDRGDNNIKRCFDWLVAFWVIAAFVYIPLLALISRWRTEDERLPGLLILLTTTYPVIPCAAALACTILLLWMYIGDGANSSLWKWLPPFALFKIHSVLGRWILVLVIVIGTIFGVVGALTGVIPPL